MWENRFRFFRFQNWLFNVASCFSFSSFTFKWNSSSCSSFEKKKFFDCWTVPTLWESKKGFLKFSCVVYFMSSPLLRIPLHSSRNEQAKKICERYFDFSRRKCQWERERKYTHRSSSRYSKTSDLNNHLKDM